MLVERKRRPIRLVTNTQIDINNIIARRKLYSCAPQKSSPQSRPPPRGQPPITHYDPQVTYNRPGRLPERIRYLGNITKCHLKKTLIVICL